MLILKHERYNKSVEEDIKEALVVINKVCKKIRDKGVYLLDDEDIVMQQFLYNLKSMVLSLCKPVELHLRKSEDATIIEAFLLFRVNKSTFHIPLSLSKMNSFATLKTVYLSKQWRSKGGSIVTSMSLEEAIDTLIAFLLHS